MEEDLLVVEVASDHNLYPLVDVVVLIPSNCRMDFAATATKPEVQMNKGSSF